MHTVGQAGVAEARFDGRWDGKASRARVHAHLPEQVESFYRKLPEDGDMCLCFLSSVLTKVNQVPESAWPHRIVWTIPELPGLTAAPPRQKR